MHLARFTSLWLTVGLAFATWSTSHATTTLPALLAGDPVSRLPGTTFGVNVRLTNGEQAAVEDFTAFFMGYQLIPQAGAVGTVTIIGVSQPVSNPVLTGTGIDVTFMPNLLLPTPINGTFDSVAAILGNDPETGDSILAGEIRNLVNLQIQASVNANGDWKLFAVNASDSGNPVSAWQKPNDATNFGFANLASDSPTAFELTVISVPEPSSWMLAGLAGGAAWCYATVRRRLITAEVFFRLPRSII
jgi:hypothetical protein